MRASGKFKVRGNHHKMSRKTSELAALYSLLPVGNLVQDGFKSFWVRFSYKSRITFTMR